MYEPDLEFSELVRRVRSNERDAIEELLRRYEPFVRREIRIGMIRSPMRRVVDSTDITQSVWHSFFVRAGAGDYEIMSSEQLRALLLTIARNKLASCIRKHNRARRCLARTETHEDLDTLSVSTETPVEMLEAQEMVEQVTQKMSEDEQQIAHLRRSGYSWLEVAQDLGGTPQGRRMQLSRAVDRIAVELGINVR